MRLGNVRVIGAVLFAMDVAPAYAQGGFFTENATKIARKVGVHVNVSVREPVDSDITKGKSVGVTFGLSPGRTSGWTRPIAFTMFDVDLHSPNGEPFATMKSVGIVGGIGYRWVFGRFSTSTSAQAGVAFNTGHIDGDIPRAFGVPDGAVALHVGNSLVFRPHVRADYMISPKFSIRGSAGYMVLRPHIDVTTPTERITDRWHPTNFHASIGLAYYPLAK